MQPYSEHFIFFSIYDRSNKLECLTLTSLSSLVLLWVRYPFLELSSIQMSEPNNLILAKSQTSSLINQRCQLSFIAKCVSLSHTVCGCWSTLSSVSINTRTHTLYLFLSLCYLALFPRLSVSLKSSLCDCSIINWNTDFTVLGCSHFIGSINTKLCNTLVYCPHCKLRKKIKWTRQLML